MHGDIGLGIDVAPPPSRRQVVQPLRVATAGIKCSHEAEKKHHSVSKADTQPRRRKTVHQVTSTYSQSNSEDDTLVAMRSSKAMDGLLLAGVGASMVEMDKLNGSNFNLKEGKPIEPGAVTPVAVPFVDAPVKHHKSVKLRSRSRAGLGPFRGKSLDGGLSRRGTLLSSAPTSPIRRAEQLKVLLGDGSGKVKPGAVISSRPHRKLSSKNSNKTKGSPDAVAFEQGRSRARVALDLELENNVAVEGGYISGTLLIRVRPKSRSDSLRLGEGKIRIAGFEVAPKNEDRFIFYQLATPLADISNGCDGLYATGIDGEGFGSVEEGEHSVRFSMQIPLVSTGGKPRGVLNPRSGSGTTIKYIIIASMKVVDPATGKRSIAHFYRECEIWSSLDPVATLAPAPDPMLARAAKKVFMGGDGTLALTASLHRSAWIAGQPVHVRLRIVNATKKSVRSISLAVVRAITLFKLGANAHDSGVRFEDDMDDGETCTNERRVAEVVLTAGQKGAKGRASAKGWWTGVGPGETRNATHSVVLPPDALTIPRARLIEVDYAIRVALSVSTLTGTSEAVHVTLPIRIVNFISLDPPPSGPILPTLQPSIIELDTPRQGSYPTSGTSGWEFVDSPPEFPMGPQHGSTGHSELYRYSRHARANTLPRNAPAPAFSTAHTVHDLGSVEDADDLEGVLGEIPGSISILEETDITVDSVDSGYSEGGCSSYSSRLSRIRCSQSGYAYTQDGEHVGMYEEGQSYEDGEVHEDVGSDEELEKMVGCASAQVDRGHFQYFAYPAISSETSEGGYHWADEGQPRLLQQYTSRRTGGTRVVHGPRDMNVGQRHEQQFAICPEPPLARGSLHGGTNPYHAQPSRRTDPSSDVLATRSMLPVGTSSSHALVERPEPMHSKSYAGTIPTFVTTSQSRLLRSSPSKSLSRPAENSRQPVLRARSSTLPSNVTQGPRHNSTLHTSPTRAISGLPIPSGQTVPVGKASSPVRARIAALDRKSSEQEEAMRVSRSLTTGAAVAHY